MENLTTPPTKRQLADELRTLEIRVRRMEGLLRGAEAVLSTIRYDGELSHRPANPDHTAAHGRAYNMIEFLGEQLEQWREDEETIDFAADELASIVRQVTA